MQVHQTREIGDSNGRLIRKRLDGPELGTGKAGLMFRPFRVLIDDLENATKIIDYFRNNFVFR
jgi:hypothetical protein